jgi:tetraacyldisaccharide 4'-kinase
MKLIIPKFWHQKTILSILLLPLSFLYRAVIFLCSKKNIYLPKAKIITIGNITIGGAGKTPVAISLINILQSHKVAILTRGYKGELKGPVIVNSTHDVFAVGDEALLLAKHSTTCVAKDRLKGIKFLESLGYDIIITDDGMQDSRFIKSLTILVVDSYFGFGNEFVFPAGPLRETLKNGFEKADLMAVIGVGKFKLDTTIPVIRGNLKGQQDLNAQKFIAFAGIGNPLKFFYSVTLSGGNIVKQIAFGDHHQYTEKELEELIELAKKNKANLITTEKDYVRISDKYKDKIQVLSVKLEWNDEAKLQQKLLNL